MKKKRLRECVVIWLIAVIIFAYIAFILTLVNRASYFVCFLKILQKASFVCHLWWQNASSFRPPPWLFLSVEFSRYSRSLDASSAFALMRPRPCLLLQCIFACFEFCLPDLAGVFADGEGTQSLVSWWHTHSLWVQSIGVCFLSVTSACPHKFCKEASCVGY